MNKYLLTLACAAWGVLPVSVAQEAHEHDGCCGHDHAPAAEEKAHQHDACCDHDHAAEKTEHQHDHAACSGHDHAPAAEEKAHQHDACCDHDHAAEKTEHQHDHAACSGHDHAPAAEEKAHQHDACCDHDHAAEKTEHQHDHAACSGHDHAPAAEEKAHQHDASCDHDHAAEKTEHQHDHAACSGHDHAPAAEEKAHQHDGCCGHDHAAEKTEHQHDHAACSGHDHAADDGPVLVTADPRSRQMLRMRVEVVPEADLALTHSLYGYLTATEHAMETYSLPCAGRISLAVKSAQSVKKGDVLYTVISPEVGAQVAELAHAESSLKRCNAELATLRSRLEKLQAIGTANSELESDYKFKDAEQLQLVQGVEVAKSRLRMLVMDAELQEQSGMTTLVVRAKSDGTVRNVGITQGSWGEQGAAVVTMSNAADMEIVATLYASDQPMIERVRATMPVGREQVAVSGSWRLDEQVNTEKQTRTLYFTPEKLPAGAAAGQLCRLDLYAGDAEGHQVSIPDSAVVRVGVDDVVFVEVKEGTYAMVKVHAGASRRGMTPVSGLVPGQRIVVKGGAELRYLLPADGQKKKSAGHFHADGKFHEGEHH